MQSGLPHATEQQIALREKMREVGERYALPDGVRRCLFIARGAPGSQWYQDPRTGEWLLIDPYAENLPAALAEWCRENNFRLTVFYEGQAPEYSPPERVPYAEKYPGVAEDLYSAEFFSYFAKDNEGIAEKTSYYNNVLFEDSGFQNAFSYRGVRLFDTMKDQMAALPRLAAGFLYNLKRWSEIFAALDPEIIFAGRLDIRADINAAAHRLGITTVAVKLGISEEMLPPFAYLDEAGAFYSQNFPDVIAVWGESQKELIERRFPECTSRIIASGRIRNDSFVGGSEDFDDTKLREFLNVSKDTKIVVYGANHATRYGQVASRVFGACCMSRHSYRRGLNELVKLAERRGDCVVVVKPHPSDELDFISQAVEAENSKVARYLTDRDGFHNALLLHSSAVFVSSVSSMFAEAVLSGCPAVNLWTDDINYLYEENRREVYGTIAKTVDSWPDLVSEVDRLLSDNDYRQAELKRAETALKPIFGGFDGSNARRLVEESFAAHEELARKRTAAG
jgi:hypothetical protein